MDTSKVNQSEPFKITGNWQIQADKLKDKFSELTDADLKFETGKEDELLSRLQTRLSKNRFEIIQLLKAGQPA